MTREDKENLWKTFYVHDNVLVLQENLGIHKRFKKVQKIIDIIYYPRCNTITLFLEDYSLDSDNYSDICVPYNKLTSILYGVSWKD